MTDSKDVVLGGGGLPATTEEIDDPSGLIRMALENRVDVESLKELVALRNQEADRNARAEFFLAVSDFQDQAPEIAKSAEAEIATKTGGKYKYTYAPLEAITRAIRPVLKANGLSFAWTTEDGGAGILNVVCVLRHIGGHEERATFPVPTDTTAKMSGAQKSGAALTYGKRQSLTSVLGLTTADEDTDGADQRTTAPDPITEEQLADLLALMTEAGADRKRFMEWLGVADLAALPQSDLGRAIKALERKREEAAK